MEGLDAHFNNLDVSEPELEAERSGQVGIETEVDHTVPESTEEQSSSFCALPPEVRVMVYKLAFATCRGVITDDSRLTYRHSLRFGGSTPNRDEVDMTDITNEAKVVFGYRPLYLRGPCFGGPGDCRSLLSGNRLIYSEAYPDFWKALEVECRARVKDNAFQYSYSQDLEPLDLVLARTIWALRRINLAQHIQRLSLVVPWADRALNRKRYRLGDIFQAKEDFHDGCLVKAFPRLKTVKLTFEDRPHPQYHFRSTASPFIDQERPKFLSEVFNKLLVWFDGFEGLETTIVGVSDPEAVKVMEELLANPVEAGRALCLV